MRMVVSTEMTQGEAASSGEYAVLEYTQTSARAWWCCVMCVRAGVMCTHSGVCMCLRVCVGELELGSCVCVRMFRLKCEDICGAKGAPCMPCHHPPTTRPHTHTPQHKHTHSQLLT